MTHLLPPNTLRLFQPRPELTYISPSKEDVDPRQIPRKTVRPFDGIGEVLESLKREAAEKGEMMDDESENEAIAENTQTREKKKEDQKKSRDRQLQHYDPKNNPEALGDPFTTLFVSRLDYSITEEELRQTFEMYGPIQRIRVVKNNRSGESRGYAFIVYENERDMRAAYKETEGIILKGNRRAMVDVERGRSVKNWKPMRLGGGLGGSSRKKKEPRRTIVTPASTSATTSSYVNTGGRSSFGGSRGPPRNQNGFRNAPPSLIPPPQQQQQRFNAPPPSYYSDEFAGNSQRYDGPPPTKRGRYSN